MEDGFWDNNNKYGRIGMLVFMAIFTLYIIYKIFFQ